MKFLIGIGGDERARGGGDSEDGGARQKPARLPELPPECVADAARPYISLDKYTVEDPDISEPIPEEKLTCDLSGLMSSLKA